MLLKKKQQQEYIVDALGDGEHSLQVCFPGRPSLVVVHDFGTDDFGDRAFEVDIIDPDSDNNLPIEWVVDYVAGLRRLRLPCPWCHSKYRILPSLPPEQYQALRDDIRLHGVQVAIIVDQYGNVIDGWYRRLACHELDRFCPTEVRYFSTEAEKFRLILSVNNHRRQMNRKQKRDLIGTYLTVDAAISDNWLASIIGGISKNTVTDERRRLEQTRQIPRLTTLRGKDGKQRPARSKRIIVNSSSELAKALDYIQDVPDNCAGRTIDVTTARRRASREQSRLARTAKAAESYPLPDSIKLYRCAFQKLEKEAKIKPASVDEIITDIPYERAWLAQVADLGKFANRVLVPGGVLLVMTGITYLDIILAKLGRHLSFQAKLETVWGKNVGTPCYVGKNAIVVTSSKPIWVFSKGPLIKKGRFITPQGPFDKEKDWHPHQQPLGLFRHLVREWTDPGDLVVDTNGGAFTTALSCYLEGRRCVSCDIDEEALMSGRERLNKAMRGEPDRP